MQRQATFVDLDSGSGGFTLGLLRAGLNLIAGVEPNQNAVAAATYAANFGSGKALVGPMANLDLALLGEPDAIVGAPHLPPLSKIGRASDTTAQTPLSEPFLSLVEQLRPPLLALVLPPHAAPGKTGWMQWVTALFDVGALSDYEVRYDILDAADFGTAQHRRRFTLIASRVGEPSFPTPTHSRSGAGGLAAWRTVRDAIGDLPTAPHEPDTDRFDTQHRSGLHIHIDNGTSIDEQALLSHIPPGGGYADIPADQRPEPRTPNHRPIYGRLRWDEPAAFIGTRFSRPEPGRTIHPHWDPDTATNRTVTALEAARLQGFPDNFRWAGSMRQIEAQIGTATPVELGDAIGRAILATLSAHDTGHAPETRTAQPRRGLQVPSPGEECVNDRGDRHTITAPRDDADLQTVLRSLTTRPDLPQLIGDAVEDAVYYVLDGARTGRFSLLEDTVDSDERRSVGTKLQYHVIENLELTKLRHPDTEIDGVGVELKGTIRENWTIPKEGQCGVTLLTRVDVKRWRHRTLLMRTHRAWLRPGQNNDGKRGIAAQALIDYAAELYEWRPLRPNPLTQLSEKHRTFILSDVGQERRFAALFEALPRVVIPRAVILTVGARRDDPLRRVRATRRRVRPNGLALLCGQWQDQRELASELGFDLTGAAWVAVPWNDLYGHRHLTTAVIAELNEDLD